MDNDKNNITYQKPGGFSNKTPGVNLDICNDFWFQKCQTKNSG